MVNVHIIRSEDGFVKRFIIKGHAGFSEYGSDIVCAAVSAVAYTALGALQEIVNIANYSEQNGCLECSIPEDVSGDRKDKADIILETMVIGIKQIEFSYSDYVKVLDEEV